jgi:hypothetical protein
LSDFLSVYGGSQKLLKIYSATAINIYLCNNIVNIANVTLQAKFLPEYVDSFFELIFGNGAIPIVVEELENLTDLEFLLT